MKNSKRILINISLTIFHPTTKLHLCPYMQQSKCKHEVPQPNNDNIRNTSFPIQNLSKRFRKCLDIIVVISFSVVVVVAVRISPSAVTVAARRASPGARERLVGDVLCSAGARRLGQRV